jgi:hypothetical protein
MANREILEFILGIVTAFIIYFGFGFNIRYTGPNSSIIKNHVYRIKNKCYKLEPVIHICRK